MMKWKKKHLKQLFSFLLVLSLVLQPAAVLKGSSSRAAEESGESVLKLYESESLVDEFASLTSAFEAMTNPEGNYALVFNDVQADYILTGVVWLPEVKSITLAGSVQSGSKTTTLTVDDDIYLRSDLLLKDFKIVQSNKEKDTSFFLGSHTMTAEGRLTALSSLSSYYGFSLVGETGSCLAVKNCFFPSGDITVDTLLLQNKGSLYFQGITAVIGTVWVSENQASEINNITFYEKDLPSKIQISKICLEDSLYLSNIPKELAIGSIEAAGLSGQNLYLDYQASEYSVDEHPYCTIAGSCNVQINCTFYTYFLSDASYQILRNEISCLKAPAMDSNAIKCQLYDHVSGKITAVACTKDTDGNIRLEPVNIEPPKEELPVELDIYSKDNQGIYYKLDGEYATVGLDITKDCNSDWEGIDNTVVKIPEKVKKDNTIYTVNRIGRNAFSRCSTSIKGLDLPDTITSIGDEAFYKTGLSEIIIGKNVESIGSCALSTGKLKKINVHTDNHCFTADNNILFDSGKKILIQFPNIESSLWKDYIVPASVETIADGAFYKAYVLHVRADSVKKVGKEAFNQSSIQDFSGENILEIGETAFYCCTNLNFVYVGEKLDMIDNRAFDGCTSLETVLLPDSVSAINSMAFSGCSNLKYFIGASHAIYQDGIVNNCPNLILFELSENAENLAATHFNGCSSLEKLYLPESYQTFSWQSFLNTGRIFIYALPKHKIQIENLSKTYVDRSSHIHTPYLVTETLKKPTETLKGIEATYCQECHYVKSAAYLPATGETPAPPTPTAPTEVSTPTPTPTSTPTAAPSVTAPAETASPTASVIPDEITPAPSEEVTVSPIPSVNPPDDSGTGSGGGGSSNGGGGGGVGGGGAAAGGGGGGAGSGGGGGAAGGNSSAAPSPSPTPTPDIVPSPTPEQSIKPFLTPSPSLKPIVSPTPTPGTASQNGIKTIKAEFTSLRLNTNNQPVLRWKKKQSVSGYTVYRSLKKTTGYRLIYMAKQNITKYTDKNTVSGRKYYYRIRVYQKQGKAMRYGKYSSIRNIRLLPLICPKITAKKGITANQIYYIQIHLQKYSGNNVALYLKKRNRYTRIKLKSDSIQKYHGTFKLQCNRKHKIYYLKAKTYIRKNGKKYYSPYSNIVKVRI